MLLGTLWSFSLGGGLALAAKVPLEPTANTTGVKYNAKFDDLPSNLNAQIRVYRGLYFKDFEAYAPHTHKTGVVPQSLPNVAVSAPPRNKIPGLQLAMNTSSFDLKSFYFGCVNYDLEAKVPLKIPRKCSVTLAGTSAYDDTLVLTQQFVFQPNAAPSPMTEAVMDKVWSGHGIDQILFHFGDESGNATGTAFMADNFVYTAFEPA